MPIPQNGQTHSNNSSAICRSIVWVCLTILWNWHLKASLAKLNILMLKMFHFNPRTGNSIDQLEMALLFLLLICDVSLFVKESIMMWKNSSACIGQCASNVRFWILFADRSVKIVFWLQINIFFSHLFNFLFGWNMFEVDTKLRTYYKSYWYCVHGSLLFNELFQLPFAHKVFVNNNIWQGAQFNWCT